MSVIRVLVFIMIHVLLTFEQSPSFKIVQKNVHFLTDIQPEYSVTAQIYQKIVQKQKSKQVRIAPQPALQTKSQPKPSQPPVQQRVEPPLVQTKQEQITRQKLDAQKFKLNIQAQIQFQEDQVPILKQQRVYTINNIDERSVMSNDQKISPLQLKSTVESKPAQHSQPTQHGQHSQQVPLQPVQGQSLNPPTSAPQSLPFFFAPRQRVPINSRQQQILDALQRRRASDPQAQDRTTISQKRQETPERAPVKELVKQTTRNQLRQQQSHQSEVKTINTTKLLFALFLMLSILIIVFSYSPQEQKPARKAYNPNDDEEINLA